LSKDAIESESVPAGVPEVKTDATGWPTSAVWPGMKQSLFLEGSGDFLAVKVNGFAPRHILADIRGRRGEAREQMRQEKLEEIPATPEGNATLQETSHTLVYTQALRHPRLEWGTRIVEIWKRQPRARFTLRINRISNAAPEIYYVAFPLPVGEALPQLSSGGRPFTPFADQLAGTCRDYFAFDGWADYVTPEGRWLWVSRDAPLMTFGDSPTLARLQSTPQNSHRLLSMIFNNFWYTNFVADEHGIMEFQFDLIWRGDNEGSSHDLAEALVTEPVMLINPAMPEDARVVENLYKP
jgi:hypothetical protein